MILMSVDPGLNCNGVVIANDIGEIIHNETITQTGKQTSEDRLYKIYSRLHILAQLFKPDAYISEKQFFGGMSESSVPIKIVAGEVGKVVDSFTPAQWKKRALGKGKFSKGKAGKREIKEILLEKYPESEKLQTEHEYDSYAMLLCYLKGE